MAFADIGKLKLYYEIAGEGPRLLFLNGSGGDLRNKPNMFDGPLAKHFELLSYDQRGLGQSDKPSRPYSMADYAGDAAGLLAYVGWERCHVLGYSFGGMVAQEVAIRFPEIVEKVVLCASTPGGAGGSSYPLHQLQELPPEEHLSRTIEIHDTRHDAIWQAANPDKVRRLAVQMQATDDRFAGEPGLAEGRVRQLEARRLHNTFARLGLITAPTLICGGRYDGSARPESQHAMLDQLPNAELRLFEGGHLFIAQDKAAYPAMIEWLNA
ncbi:MAG: alpha/beta fold hydrolase [Alphaproteobacteria bacterium]